MPDRNPQGIFQLIMARETKPVSTRKSKVAMATKLFSGGVREQRSAEQQQQILEEIVPNWTYQDLRTNTQDITDRLGNMEIEGSMKKGGMVKKTGVYLLHKGEKVIPANQVKKNKTKYKK